MAIELIDGCESRLSDKKPYAVWRADDGQHLECPFCGREELSDDRLGFHLVRDHWREIDHATRRVRDMCSRRK